MTQKQIKQLQKEINRGHEWKVIALGPWFYGWTEEQQCSACGIRRELLIAHTGKVHRVADYFDKHRNLISFEEAKKCLTK